MLATVTVTIIGYDDSCVTCRCRERRNRDMYCGSICVHCLVCLKL